MNELRSPPTQFVKDFVRFYISSKSNPEAVEGAIYGFRNKGLDMDMFYWMDPQLNPSPSEIRDIIQAPEYGFTPKEIDEIVKKTEDGMRQ